MESDNVKSAGAGDKNILGAGDNEYAERRKRNNIAVRKSRDKTRLKNKETQERVEQLKSENAKLEEKVKLLSKELTVLKELFLVQAKDVPDPSTTYALCNAQHNVDKQPSLEEQDFQMETVDESTALKDHQYSRGSSS
ncbi:CCAAT/enhancer-binding protein gamma-like [Anneissia japonica]|uniref:CCAAT/enhancer-binding protein gamma-like n=1 Tax=Anneissia japonica TaxID=1529436 RepID=UPI001425672D|nr:CCAAT/enhancer-binding protein gamma-like [Anneissia japonica]